MGVIYVPVRKELYFAADSLGAFKLAEIDYGYQPSMDEIKTKAIRLPMPMGHQGVVVVASRSHQTEETTAFIENLRKQGQPITLISSGRNGRCLSPFRTDDGVGYRRRTCDCTGGRMRSLSYRWQNTFKVQ